MATFRMSKQVGFGAVTIIVLIVVLILVIVAGVFVYKQSNKADERTAVVPSKASPIAKPSASSSIEQDVKEVSRLDIKEWGISVPLAESVKDAYYTTTGSGTAEDGQDNTAWISLSSLNGTSCDVAKTGPTEVVKPVGAILRVIPTDTDPVKGRVYKDLYPDGVTIGAHYYVYTPWANTTCLTKDMVQTLSAAFTAAVKNATPTLSQ